MPVVSRKGDSCTGHGNFPPRASIVGSDSVFVNGVGVLRVGDGFGSHCNSSPSCHVGSLSSGSGSVFANGKALGRIGDDVGCGSAVSQGSSNVFAGD